MKNLALKFCFYLLFLTLSTLKTFGQSDKGHFFETGLHLFGAGFSYEKNLSESFAIRSSLEYDGSIYFSSNVFSNGNKTVIVLQPAIKLQPRYYYNINKRKEKGRNIAYNAANFLSAQIGYKSSELNVSNESVYKPEVVTFGAAWNIRRCFGDSNFIYEISLGIRYDSFLQKFYKRDNGLTPDLNAKIGYVF